MYLITVHFKETHQTAKNDFFSSAIQDDLEFIRRLNQTDPLAFELLDFTEFTQVFCLREHQYAGYFEVNSEAFHELFKALRRIIHHHPSLNIQHMCRSHAFKIEFQLLKPAQKSKPFLDLSIFNAVAPKMREQESQTEEMTLNLDLRSFSLGVVCCLTLVALLSLNFWAIAASIIISGITICHTFHEEIEHFLESCYD